MFFLLVFPFPPFSPVLLLTALVVCLLMLFTLLRSRIPLPTIITSGLMTVLLVNCCMNTGFYPKLLQYQMHSPVTHFIITNKPDKSRFYLYEMPPSNSLDFYNNYSFKNTFDPDSIPQKSYLLTGKDGLVKIHRDRFNLVDSVYTFHVSALTLPFLNPSTRKENCDMFYILKRL
jgi:hypothetical protein